MNLLSDDPQALAMQFEQGQRQLQQLDRHLASLEQNLGEIQLALATIDGLAEADADLDTLVPIGGGVQVPAKIAGDAKVMVHLGAGYATETDVAVARERLQGRLERTQAAFRSTSQEAEQIAAGLQRAQAAMQAAAPGAAPSA